MKTFDEWWKEGTSVKVPLYGEANAKKAWDYQQIKLDEHQKVVASLMAIAIQFSGLGQAEIENIAAEVLARAEARDKQNGNL
ncbi:MAG: hypothetical protein DRR06_15720 [Gammaproteobacteria bacterium]|nr:MAG: hypothetical protein DRR06_15720 [Gammaproteobacteria bacterium]